MNLNEDSKIKYQHIFSLIASEIPIVQAALFLLNNETNKYQCVAGFAFVFNNEITYELGEGFIGQAALSKKIIVIDKLPVGYINVVSGLGESNPSYLSIIPIEENDKIIAVIEIATFAKINIEDITNMILKYKSEFNKLIFETA